jgi:hypothetical protein
MIKGRVFTFKSPRNRPPSRHVPKEIAAGSASTDGKGFWSTAKKTIHFVLEMPYAININPYKGTYYGSMNAYFLPEEWDTTKDGLIYTDRTFEKGVRDTLRRAGFKYASNLHYSEQGMQGGVGFHRGEHYVNFDVGNDLAHELVAKGYAIVEEN